MQEVLRWSKIRKGTGHAMHDTVAKSDTLVPACCLFNHPFARRSMTLHSFRVTTEIHSEHLHEPLAPAVSRDSSLSLVTAVIPAGNMSSLGAKVARQHCCPLIHIPVERKPQG
jgi:hypothetical protein